MRIPWSGPGPSTRSGRGSPPGGRRKWWLLAVPALGIAVICQLSLTGTAGAATAVTTAKTVATGGIAPNPVNELDCNGFSPKYGTVRKMAANCTDPIKIVKNGKAYRFEDNGRYIGHDELRQHDDLPDQAPGRPGQGPDRERQRDQLRSVVRRALVRAPDV